MADTTDMELTPPQKSWMPTVVTPSHREDGGRRIADQARSVCTVLWQYVNQDVAGRPERLAQVLEGLGSARRGSKPSDDFIRDLLVKYNISASYVVRKAAIELLDRLAHEWTLSRMEVMSRLRLGRVVEKSLRVDAALNIIRKVVNDDPSRPYESLVFKMAM